MKSLFTAKTGKMLTVIVSVVTLFAVLLCLTGCGKGSKYKEAEELFNNGNYDEAIAIFESLEDYKDSAEQIVSAKLGKAKALIESGDTAGAETLLNEIKDADGAAELLIDCHIAAAKAEGENGNYEEAINQLSEIYADSKSEKALEGIWSMLDSAFDKSDLDSALTILRGVPEEGKNDDYKFLLAEYDLRRGRLQNAKEEYQQLPEDYSRNDVAAKDRLQILEDNADAVSLCGVWEPTVDAHAEIKATSKTSDRWESWDADLSGVRLTIACPYDVEKGSFQIAGKLEYGYISNYSSSGNLKASNGSASFLLDGSKMPETVPIDDQNITLTFSGKSFDFSFKLVNTTANANYSYESTVHSVIDKLTTAY